MNKIANWLKGKTYAYSFQIKKSKHNLNISINEENIKQVKNTTFLGMGIDEFLTWRDHIDLTKKKTYQMCHYYFQD